MLKTETAPYSALFDATSALKSARAMEPNPLHPEPGEVVNYVAALKQADVELARLLERPADLLSLAEVEAVKRRRGSIDASIARQASLAGRRLGADRAGSIATLNYIFKMGSSPSPALDGRYRGELITPTMYPALDSFGRAVGRVWLPWMGKRFNHATSSGDNVFTPSARIVGRLFWPRFSDYSPYKPGLYTAFDFTTYEGPGLEDHEITTLKLDYGSRANPALLVRSIIDEVVQISGDYYLGKAFLKGRSGALRLAAFFALRRQP